MDTDLLFTLPLLLSGLMLFDSRGTFRVSKCLLSGIREVIYTELQASGWS